MAIKLSKAAFGKPATFFISCGNFREPTSLKKNSRFSPIFLFIGNFS